MLRLGYLFENFALARRALENYSHDESRLDEAFSWFRISANAVYPYFDKGELCFLRMAPAEEKPMEHIRAEIELIEYLIDNGYPAMQPIAALNGEKCIALKTEWGDWNVSAFRRVKGKCIEDSELTDDLLFDYGKALGRLHALTENFEPNIRRQSHEDILNNAERMLLDTNAPEHMLRELRDIRRGLAALPRGAGEYGLVHYDFEPDNVFYSPEERLCSVIDFDDSAYHWYALDVEQAFDSLCELFENEAELTAAKERFMSGYCSEHAFTEAMSASMPLMRRAIDIYSYARLRHCLSDKPEERPEWLQNLEIKLNSKLERMETHTI